MAFEFCPAVLSANTSGYVINGALNLAVSDVSFRSVAGAAARCRARHFCFYLRALQSRCVTLIRGGGIENGLSLSFYCSFNLQHANEDKLA